MMFHEAAEEKFQRGAQEHGDWDQIDHIAEIKDELLDLYNYASKDPRDLRMWQIMSWAMDMWEQLDIHTPEEEDGSSSGMM